MVSKPSAGLLDDDRRRSVVPDIAGEPDDKVQLSFCGPVLVAPRSVDRDAVPKAFEELLIIGNEGVVSRKTGDSFRIRLPLLGDADANAA